MKKSIVLTVSAICACFALASCSYQEMMDKIVPKEEARMAEDYLARLREGDFEYIKSKLSNEIKPKATDALLVQSAECFRKGKLLSTELIGCQVNVVNGVWQGNFTFEYHFSDGWNVASAAFRKVGDGYEVVEFLVYQTQMSQRELNAFSLSNKSFLHYLLLALAVLVPLFILVSTCFCVLTPIPKRKWLWVIFVLLGVGAIRINWTTGQLAIKLLTVELFGASRFAAGPHAPWVISASIPLGAILFWAKRKRYLQLSERAGNSFNLEGADNTPQD